MTLRWAFFRDRDRDPFFDLDLDFDFLMSFPSLPTLSDRLAAVAAFCIYRCFKTAIWSLRLVEIICQLWMALKVSDVLL